MLGKGFRNLGWGRGHKRLGSEIWEMMVYLTSLTPESRGLSWLLRSLVLFCGLGPSEVLSMTFFEARKLCFTP